MAFQTPYLTAFDPLGTGEGSLDPLGLYQIADQLAVDLVPAVRERMQRIRFLTAMAVGSIVTEGLDDDPMQRDGSPYLVWEWLLVEALIRKKDGDETIWGVPGTLVTRRALSQHGYMDARSYLKTPRVFGFHGVYKRLATHIGIVNVHLDPGPYAEKLVDLWARGLGLGGIAGAKPLLSRWSAAVRRSLNEKPPRTKTGWTGEEWTELAEAFAPSSSKAGEKEYLRTLLLSVDGHTLGALPNIWKLQNEFDEEGYGEEVLHNRLVAIAPSYKPLIEAVKAYEAFARRLQDAFDLLRAEAARLDVHGFVISNIALDKGFIECVNRLHEFYGQAYRALGEVPNANLLQSLFTNRFEIFRGPLDAGAYALALCDHHEKVQKAKSADGKRPWFDRIGNDRIYLRHPYRTTRKKIQPDRYVHDYRGRPIRRFHSDLT